MSPKEIETAVRQALEGREEGYTSLFAAFAGQVYRFVAQAGVPPGDAEELTQDVFLRAFRALDGYRPERAAFATWLLRIAHNAALNRLRRSEPSVYSLDEAMPLCGTDDEDTFATEQTERLVQAIGRLRGEERALLQLYYYDGLALREVSYVTGIDPAALSNRLLRIRHKLRKLMEDGEQTSIE